tara:strand:- start:2811 stop:4349 length:1539 start_codon:yes stop_codon:yes gene_type:complete
MSELEKFINIFEGLNSAYGQTVKTDQFSEKGKHKTKSFTISNPVTKKLWEEHLKGSDPGLGIVPINKENKCKWGCIDIDTYPFDHKKFIIKLKEKNVPMIVCRSKSGGAHAFLFTKQFVPAAVMRAKLKIIASAMGFASAEIFPKQDYIRVDRGDTGSFLNLPYHASERTVRYAYGVEANVLTLEEFFEVHENTALTEPQLNELKIESDKEEKDSFKGMPPCLVTLLNDGVPDGQRNNCMYNVGVYLKKRYPDKEEWQGHMFTYNKQFMSPPLDANEINTLIGSLDSKDYNYKCKDEPIHSFCDAKKCALREFGVGDNAPTPEITEIRKYDSDPPIYFASIDGESVEVDDATLHDPEKFSLACMNQIGKPMMPVPKHMWRRLLIKLFANLETIPAPDSSKLDVQLKEILADYINKTPGKEIKDVMRGIAFTDTDGFTYFKFKDFWKFLLKTKSWAERTYPKQKTMRLLQSLFEAEEASPKVGAKTVRLLKMPTVKLERPNPRTTKIDKSPWL